ncbi:MAG: DUF1048 domain-containing protein [Actinomycetales bacterium]|nr:DUF1048 domain-containing protein [Actinomycetales bacterium]
MWIERITGDLADKRKWREYKARVKALPPAYREAAAGIERYIMHFGAVDDGPTLVRMFGDLGDLLEGAAADQTPIRDLVGEDPVQFLETFLDTYRGEGRSWIDKQRAKLTASIDSAIAAQESGAGSAGAGR